MEKDSKRQGGSRREPREDSPEVREGTEDKTRRHRTEKENVKLERDLKAGAGKDLNHQFRTFSLKKFEGW